MSEALGIAREQNAMGSEQTEAIRLIIWDLDETFWKGTLTEGGLAYSRETHEIVIALAKRGIVSSICSKNDHTAVESILREQGIWDYFIFPSIDWSTKGPRVAGIINAAKLRAPSVLFIDDNPINLAEAKYFCEGIQTADQTVIPELLSHPLLVGKSDPALSRLTQYKVLEQKHEDTKTAGGDNIAFLRSSRIRVYIEHEVEKNLDRAVELINRTNQLNFTKIRLSEDLDIARQELSTALSAHNVNSGLVYATDRYGDYGCIGFYLLVHGPGFGRRLTHYCFSCRTLGMDIEKWLYARLGEPHISIVGEVITGLRNYNEQVDWISEVSRPEDLVQDAATIQRLQTLIVHGGCDVRAVEHYVEGMFSQVFEEMNDVVNYLEVRTDHSIFLRYALKGISPEVSESFEPLCFRPRHFTSAITDLRPGSASVVLLSLWSDGRIMLYRDRETGILLPIYLPGQRGPNVLAFDDTALTIDLTTDVARRAASYLRERFDFHGPITVDEYRSTVSDVLAAIPNDTLVIFMQSPVFWYKEGTNEKFDLGREALLNGVNLEIACNRANVRFLDPHFYAEKRDEYLDFFHFRRPVYQRIGFAIRELIDEFFGATHHLDNQIERNGPAERSLAIEPSYGEGPDQGVKSDSSAITADWRRALQNADNGNEMVVQMAETLFQQRRYKEADELLTEALARFPHDAAIAREYAACASQDDRHDDAIHRWQAAYERFPSDIWTGCGLGRALMDIGRFEEARGLLGKYVPDHVTHRGLLEVRAELATRMGEWNESLIAWRDLATKYPDDIRLRNSLSAAQLSAKLAVLGNGQVQDVDFDVVDNALACNSGADSKMRRIISNFENLGDNCEFALVQRYFGAEPIGLLRWAGTSPEQIIAAAETGFGGIAEPENTNIDLWPNGEYYVTDKRFGMLTPSFTHQATVDRDAFSEQQLRRGRYLRAKFVEDLKLARRIFIYKSATITDRQVRQLSDAMRQIGPICLLVVRLSDDANPPGTVKRQSDGLLLGYIDKFLQHLEPITEGSAVVHWSAICCEVFDRWMATMPGSASLR